MGDMQQSLRQASIRTITGTTGTVEEDWHALFTLDGIATGPFNQRMLLWINDRLGTSYTEINGAMAAFAADQGADNFGAVGSFVTALIAPVITGPGTTSDTTPNLSIALDSMAIVDDVITVQYSATSNFASYTELTDTLDAAEIAGLPVSLEGSALAPGTWYFRVKHSRPSPVATSDWSNTETVIITAANNQFYSGVHFTGGTQFYDGIHAGA